MAKFSERYGYTKVSDVIIREDLPLRVSNGLYNILNSYMNYDFDKHFWLDYLGERVDNYEYGNGNDYEVIWYLTNEKFAWYDRLDVLEYILKHFNECLQVYGLTDIEIWAFDVTKRINKLFEKENFAYRIIDNNVVEITSKGEILEVEEATGNKSEGVRKHLNTAIKKLSASQETPDYRNSIKESISAVEVLCREITGEKTLGQALGRLEANGVDIHFHIRNSMDKLYTYTNDESTGIRHAQMDSRYEPTADEAIFMLVTCSAFINYLTKKNQ